LAEISAGVDATSRFSAEHHNHYDTHCCHMGTAIKHPLPDRVKPSFVIFDIRSLWCSVGVDWIRRWKVYDRSDI